MKKGKKKINIKINFSNRWLYTLIAIGIIAVIGVGVYALTPGVVPNPGHNINEVSVPSGCTSGQFLQFDGSNWVCASAGAGAGQSSWPYLQDIKATTATHNGNFGGYQAMYNWIQTNGCSGYHVCTSNEVASAAQAGLPAPMPAGQFAWYDTYTYSEDRSGNAIDDCDGWGSASGSVYGNHLATPSGIYLLQRSSCSTVRYVVCCKSSSSGGGVVSGGLYGRCVINQVCLPSMMIEPGYCSGSGRDSSCSCRAGYDKMMETGTFGSLYENYVCVKT